MDGRVLNFREHFGEIIWNYGMMLKKSCNENMLIDGKDQIRWTLMKGSFSVNSLLYQKLTLNMTEYPHKYSWKVKVFLWLT
jgi:hypothetical protein